MMNCLKKLILVNLLLLPMLAFSQSSATVWQRTGKEITKPDESKDKNILLFPNPSTEEVTVSTKDGMLIQSIRILNLAGSEIYRNEKINRSKRRLDISDYINGVYSIEVITADRRRLFLKIVKR